MTRRAPGAAAAPVRRTVLANGLVAIARRNSASRSITVRLTFAAGAAFDPPGLPGTAELVAGLLDRGAGERSAAAIAERFDFLGASFVARNRRDTLDLEARLLSAHLPEILDLVADMALHPVFPEAELERERAQLLTAIAERDQDTRQIAEEALAAALYPPGHPYHASALGDAATAARITRDDLAAFHRARFRPRGAVIVCAGDLDPDAVFRDLDRRFGSWRDGEGTVVPAVPPDPPPLREASIRIRPVQGKTQADIGFGFPAIRRSSPELPAAMVLSSILGEFSLGGRLGAVVRERAGLAYYAYSRVSAGRAAGAFVIRAGVAMAEVRRACALVRRTIARTAERGVTAAELRDSRQAIARAVPRRLETNPEAAHALSDAEFHGLGIDYLDRLPQRIAEVRSEDVHRLARRVLVLDRCVLVAAGPDLKEEDLR